MNDNCTADLTVAGKVCRLVSMRQKLRNTFKNVTEMIYEFYSNEIETAGWKRKTETQYTKYFLRRNEKFGKIIREFLTKLYMAKVNCLNEIKWIKTKNKKDNTAKKVDFRQVLSHDQIIKLVENTAGRTEKSPVRSWS